MVRGARLNAAASALVAVAVCLATAATGQTPPERSSAPPLPFDRGRVWTLNDIVTAPEIAELVLSSDGSQILYLSRQADIVADRKASTLHKVDLNTGADRILIRANWIESVKPIPGSSAWSALADLGQGVQLYRINRDGQTTPLTHVSDTVLFGQADGAVASNASDAPRRIGVIGYAWSPSGRSLWYARIRALPTDLKPMINDEAWLAGWRRRWIMPAVIEYRLVTQGEDVLIAERPALDRVAMYYAGNVTWDSESPSYVTEDQDEAGRWHYAAFAWDAEARRATLLAEGPVNPFGQPNLGPNGGRIQTKGFGADRRLEEVAADGTIRTYGPVDFVLDDPRASGHWVSSDGARAVVGIREITHPRYGLVVLKSDLNVHQIEVAGSLTHCDFNAAVNTGICVHEGMVSCCRFRGHRDRVFFGTGGWRCNDGSSAGSSSSRR